MVEMGVICSVDDPSTAADDRLGKIEGNAANETTATTRATTTSRSVRIFMFGRSVWPGVRSIGLLGIQRSFSSSDKDQVHLQQQDFGVRAN